MPNTATEFHYVIEKRDDKWCLLTQDKSKVLGCHDSQADAEAQERAVQAAKHTLTYCCAGGPIDSMYGPLSKTFDELLKDKENSSWQLISTLQDSIFSILNDRELEAVERSKKLGDSLNQFLSEMKSRLPELTTGYAELETAVAKYWGDLPTPPLSKGTGGLPTKKKKKAGTDYESSKAAEDPEDATDDGDDEDEEDANGKKIKQKQKPAMDPEQSYELKDVEVFATGTWNGDKYTEKDLDEMVEAFKNQNFIPPLKAGHDETPGRPALGWVANLRRVGEKLVADFSHLPKDVYDLIKRRGYDRVSSEIYWNLKSGSKTFRRALKAVALLGADVPAVTTLAPLHTLFTGHTGQVKFYDTGGSDMAASDKEMLAALTETVANLQKQIGTGNGEGDGAKVDPTVLKALTAVTEQVRVLHRRITETEVAETKSLQLTEELEKAHSRIAALEDDSRNTRIKTWVEEVKIPAFRPYVRALLDVATRENRVVKFEKRDGKVEDKTIESVVKAFIAELNDSVVKGLFKETMMSHGAHRTKAGDDVNLEDKQAVANYVDRKTREYMAQYKVKDYALALDQVLSSEPELKSAYLQ
jgi:hypothetical protein